MQRAEYNRVFPHAEVAELADAADSKSADPLGRGGSIPPFGIQSGAGHVPCCPLCVWRNNSLSIVLFGLFVFCVGGHAWSGWKTYNAEQRQHSEPEISLSAFVTSEEFAETVFENWESEFLQMGFYVILTVFLYQRGSSESKKPDGTNKVEEDPDVHRNDPDAPGPVKTGGWRLRVYKSSLSLAFLILFLVSFIGHAAAGARKYNAEQRQHQSPEHVTTMSYMQTPQFWYESFQNWQSEFLAVLAIVVLSIHLRQWGSPESKPVHAPHAETGSG